MNRRDIIVIPAAAIAVMALNVAIAFAVVWLYSSFFNPGRPASHYEAFATRAAPISSVVAGIPLMFFAGFVIAGMRHVRRGLLVAASAALLYIFVDTAILVGADAGRGVWSWAALSHATKLASALAGAKFRMIRLVREPSG
jgi:hypothetical protein